MAEPNTAVLAGALTGAVISPVSLVLGAHVDALVIGLTAAVVMTIWMESIDNRRKALAAVLMSSMLAGYGSPVAANWAQSSVPSVSLSGDALRLLLALLIGGAAPSLVPLLLRAFGRRIEEGCKP